MCISSWTRIAPNTLPALAKAGANYMNSQLIKMEAVLNGFDEGIALGGADEEFIRDFFVPGIQRAGGLAEEDLSLEEIALEAIRAANREVIAEARRRDHRDPGLQIRGIER